MHVHKPNVFITEMSILQMAKLHAGYSLEVTTNMSMCRSQHTNAMCESDHSSQFLWKDYVCRQLRLRPALASGASVWWSISTRSSVLPWMSSQLFMQQLAFLRCNTLFLDSFKSAVGFNTLQSLQSVGKRLVGPWPLISWEVANGWTPVSLSTWKGLQMLTLYRGGIISWIFMKLVSVDYFN